MPFSDLTSYLEDDSLELPDVPSSKYPEGKTYRVPSPDHKTGLRLTAMVNLGLQAATAPPALSADELAALPDSERRERERQDRDMERTRQAVLLDDEQERDFLPTVLGSAYDEMTADGVSWVRLQKISRYALVYFTLGEDAADDMLRRSAEGNAPKPNRAQRRASSPPAGSGTATSTRRPGSRGGSTPRTRTTAA